MKSKLKILKVKVKDGTAEMEARSMLLLNKKERQFVRRMEKKYPESLQGGQYALKNFTHDELNILDRIQEKVRVKSEAQAQKEK